MQGPYAGRNAQLWFLWVHDYILILILTSCWSWAGIQLYCYEPLTNFQSLLPRTYTDHAKQSGDLFPSYHAETNVTYIGQISEHLPWDTENIIQTAACFLRNSHTWYITLITCTKDSLPQRSCGDIHAAKLRAGRTSWQPPKSPAQSCP